MKIILHICCGVCAAGVVERLNQEGHEVLGFFYNPNIHPREEYERRLEVAYKVSKELKFHLVAGPYKPEEWLEATNSLGKEPEGGRRCEVCFRIRLEKTCLYLQDYGGDAFTTTLTVSPSKSTKMVNLIGKEVDGERFLSRDFKKKAGFQHTIELAKKWSLDRQNYCGCIYSLRDSQPDSVQ
ncbi:epoxyqueuosine reductase QueH [Chloroflexota bacterium]